MPHLQRSSGAVQASHLTQTFCLWAHCHQRSAGQISCQENNFWDDQTNKKKKEETMDWITFLNVMIEDEKAAKNKYRLAMEQADSEKLKAVLERLMDEEQVHIDFLEEEIRRLQAS
jgi:rubrerythrin